MSVAYTGLASYKSSTNTKDDMCMLEFSTYTFYCTQKKHLIQSMKMICLNEIKFA